MSEGGERFYNKIFFCDVIGYSKLDPPRQFACQRTLNRVVTDVLASLGCELERDVIALPTGDGLILNFLHAAPDIHLRTARMSLEGLHAQPSQPPIGLRIGLNSFVDTWVRDINGKKNVVGAGINMAQRVMDLGRHGQILMHDRVRTDLANYSDYTDRVVFRGNFRVKHGVEVPVAQYVEPGCEWITEDPAEPPPVPTTLDLDALLKKRVQETVLTLKLDRRAKDNIPVIVDYAESALDEIGVLQRLKMAAGWIVAELIQNVFDHGPKDRPIQDFELRLDRSRVGLLISVVQDDAAPFDLAEVLRRPGAGSFMQMMSHRGLHWHERTFEGRRELGLELPADLDLRPMWATTIAPSADGTPSSPVVVAPPPFRRIDETSYAAFHEWVALALTAARREGGVLALNLDGVEFISSRGLRGLTIAQRDAGSDTPLILVAPSPRVREVLALSRYDKLFSVYPGVEDAVAAFGGVRSGAVV